MARVSHPNVVQVHACGEFHGNPYFVMEFIEGQTLEQWIPRHPGDMDGAFRILDGICEGVTAIHAAGTTHRDLKPANVLLDEHLRPKVTDFGLAQRWQDERPVQFEVAGTPAYMAPEVICGDEYERARRPGADVYSLGCLAYEIVTGRPPFQSSQARATLLKHLVDEVLPPSSVCAHSYPELDDAIQRALAKDPTKRTPTAEVFRRDLAAARARAREPARILVADDDDDFRRAIAQLLAESFPGAELECVTDGRQALDAFDRNRPSVAIVDFQMPELDGLQLTERLRSRDPAGSVPIIVLTASAGAPEWQRLAAAGADRLLVKPVSTDDVVAVVRRCLVERVGQARR
jgi:serine/threonine-protein kinase